MTLKAALQVLWTGDEDDEGGIATAQTILEAADVSLPTGDLANGAYDVFGALYSLPEWVVSDPVNMVVEAIDEVEDGLVKGSPAVIDEEEEAARRREEKGKAVLAAADIIAVKARLSDRGGADVTVHVGKADSVRLLTKRIFEESGVSTLVSPPCSLMYYVVNKHTNIFKLQLPPSKRIKIVYMGKMLKENESLLSQGWKDDHIINALVFD
jgi:hypothetical protein